MVVLVAMIVEEETAVFKEMALEVLTLKFVPCHRLPERSLFIKGKQMPVCTRCMFMIIGTAFIPLLLLTSTYLPLWLGIVLNIPMVLDGYTQLKRWRSSTNLLRGITGLMSGFGLSILAVSGAFELSNLIRMFL